MMSSHERQSLNGEKPGSKPGARLDFRNLSLTIPAKRKTPAKTILHNVSGYALPGEILYIMGPSGAGKTSLLDSISGRTKVAPTGDVMLAGCQKTARSLKALSKYCTQEMQLYEAMTVKETLQSAAALYTTDKAERASRVDKALTMLGLDGQASVKIGGIFFRGCSGGQRRRVTVGETIVANPQIMFLDEPTSGLDSAAAYQLMLKLKDIARTSHITVVCSIHQPSERVFELSDRLLLLAGGANGGNTTYFGPTKDAAAYFEAQDLSRPDGTSVAEWLLDSVNGDFSDDVVVKKVVDYWPTSSKNDELQRELCDLEPGEADYALHDMPSFYGLTMTLMLRNFRNIVRNPAVLWLRFLMYMGLSGMIGTVWWQAGDEPLAGEIANVAGVLFFIAAFMAFMSISVLPAFLEDKAIFVKDRANGAYGVGPYSLAGMLISLPFIFLLSVAAGSICYFCLGLNPGDGRFFLFIMNLFVTLAVAESICLLIATVVPFFIVGIAAGAFAFGAFMVVEGFFIKVDDIPAAWRWMHWVAFHSYSFANFMYIEFDGRTIKADPNAVPPAPEDFSGDMVLKAFEFEDQDVWLNMAVMAGMMLIYRGAAMLWSYTFHHGKK
eukprot:COSAG02_NODE_756_length_17532_cov_5.673550_2_plen_609_part_00